MAIVGARVVFEQFGIENYQGGYGENPRTCTEKSRKAGKKKVISVILFYYFVLLFCLNLKKISKKNGLVLDDRHKVTEFKIRVSRALPPGMSYQPGNRSASSWLHLLPDFYIGL